jgi:hypothetical protein
MPNHSKLIRAPANHAIRRTVEQQKSRYSQRSMPWQEFPSDSKRQAAESEPHGSNYEHSVRQRTQCERLRSQFADSL